MAEVVCLTLSRSRFPPPVTANVVYRSRYRSGLRERVTGAGTTTTTVQSRQSRTACSRARPETGRGRFEGRPGYMMLGPPRWEVGGAGLSPCAVMKGAREPPPPRSAVWLLLPEERKLRVPRQELEAQLFGPRRVASLKAL